MIQNWSTMFYRIAALLYVSASLVSAQTVFVSELHYENSDVESGEAIELTGTAGQSLAGWTLILYNGTGGSVYDTIDLSGTFSDLSNGFGALAFFREGIQNGSPDGLALVNADGEVVQFLSYEGVFTAEDGAAEGLESTDIGVSEDSSLAAGQSLQLVGTGSVYSDFSWTADVVESFGAINDGLDLVCVDSCEGSTDATSGVTAPPTSAPTPAPTTNLCSQTAMLISTVQGSGTATPLDGTVVTVRGTVTAVFPGLDGFFLQDSGDGDSSTSDGIFIYQGADPTVNSGDEVAVSGTATEFFNQTQITFPGLEVCSTGHTLPTPVMIFLPSDESILESLEGMLVTIYKPVVTENFNAGRFGEITVAAERLWQFTQTDSPGTVPTVETGTTVVLDDGASGTYPNPAVYVDQAPTIRVGQTLQDVTGIMSYGFSSYRVHPLSTNLRVGDGTNTRPTTAPPANGNVRVASFNVLNYFTTLGSRGAETEEQRQNQLTKITAGVLAIDADAIAIVEVENDYNVTTPSIQVIADSLNEGDLGADWQYVVPSIIPLGYGEIAVGIIYDANTLTLEGPSDVLDYNDTKTRASLAQTFAVKCDNSDSCPAFTLVSSHFKSKGSDCEDLDDPDTDDGQGNCNLTRTRAMQTLIEWVQGSSIAVTYDADILLAGDFNAYAQEDPIQAAASAGFVDLSTSDQDYPRVSSFVFFGESGTLDYILATSSAQAQRLGNLVFYHVNADETSALEYDDCGTNDACTVSLDQYRCSDHDVVIQDFVLV